MKLWAGSCSGGGRFCLLILLFPLLDSAGRGCPAASNFLLLRQKKVTKEKATRSLGPSAALRATCGARFRRGPAKLAFGSDNAGPDPLVSALLGPARTGQSGTEYQKTKKTNTNKDTLWRVLVSSGIRYWYFLSPPPCVCAEERRFRRIRDRVV